MGLKTKWVNIRANVRHHMVEICFFFFFECIYTSLESFELSIDILVITAVRGFSEYYFSHEMAVFLFLGSLRNGAKIKQVRKYFSFFIICSICYYISNE